MAQGQWVNIPGKGRRWQQPSGELMMQKPGLGFVQAQLAPVTNFLGGMFKSSGLPAYQMSGPGLQQARQKNLTGREKINKAWGMLWGDAFDIGGFAYRTGNGKPYSQPSYADAQGNIYDAVSGRLLYPAKNSSDTGAGSTEAGSSSPGSPAAERAYESEKSRVAQLTAQDPELQRYENARKAAKTQEEMNAARDIGMQIWQQKYGNTPMGQPGGAIGMRNPLMDRTFGYQTGSAPDQQMGAPTLGPSPLVPQVDQSLNPASPNYIGGEGAPLMDFTRDEVNPELIAAYQKQLLEQASAGRK